MAKNRMVNTSFWDDSYIATLSVPEKLLFLYLITNALTNVMGVYEIRVARMALDTGIEESSVERILKNFQAHGKITHINGWVIVHNFENHQTLRGDLIDKAKRDLVKKIPEKVYKAYASPLQGVSADTSVSESVSVSNNKYSDEIKIVSNRYTALINEKAKLTDGANRKIQSRLKNYSKEQLAEAMSKFSQDRWQMKHNAHRGMAWFFHSDDRIEQYINLKPRKGMVVV